MKFAYQMKKKRKNISINVNMIIEYIYFCVFIMWLSISFLYTTRFDMNWVEPYYTLLHLVLIGVVLAKACYCKTYSIWEICMVFILYVAFSFSISRNEYKELMDLFLLIVGAKDISFKKLLKAYAGTLGILLLFTMGMALTGRIENLIYFQEGRRPRIAFGIGYPTDFSAYVFYILLAYFCFRGKKVSYIEIGGSVLMGFFVYWFCDARLNTICIFIMTGVFLYNKLIHLYYNKKNKIYSMNPIWQQLLTLSTSIAAIFMVTVTILYSIDNKILVYLNGFLNNRLLYGKLGYDRYGLSFWGQYIPQQGAGGSLEAVKHYFWLDVSYVSILLKYGIIILGMVLIIWMIIGIKAQKKRNWELLWAIALVALQCTIEHHMLEIVYAPILLALFARVESSEEIVRKF